MNNDVFDKIKALNDERKCSDAKEIYNSLNENEKTNKIILEYARTLVLQLREDEALELIENIKNEAVKDFFFCFRYATILYYNNRFKDSNEWFLKAQREGVKENIDTEKFEIAKWIDRTRGKIDYIDYIEEKRKVRNKNKQENVNFSKDVLDTLWSESEYSIKEYIGTPPTEDDFIKVEKELGYTLPKSYKELMKIQNGGIVSKVILNEFKSYYIQDVFDIECIYGVDPCKRYSLLGEMGSKFWIEEWGYPDIGIAICSDMSGGHGIYFLDYSDCGKDGEPCVVYIAQESSYNMSYIADSFESFINGLIDEDFEI